MDIVERLRQAANTWDVLSMAEMKQAADEIERLREENNYFRKLIQTSQLNALDKAFARSALQQKDSK